MSIFLFELFIFTQPISFFLLISIKPLSLPQALKDYFPLRFLGKLPFPPIFRKFAATFFPCFPLISFLNYMAIKNLGK